MRKTGPVRLETELSLRPVTWIIDGYLHVFLHTLKNWNIRVLQVSTGHEEGHMSGCHCGSKDLYT